MSADACLSDEQLCALASDESPGGVQAAHLAACAACSERLRRLRSEVTTLRKLYGGSRQRAEADAPRKRPAFIGKYFIVGVLDEQERLSAYRGLHSMLHVEVVVWRSRVAWDSTGEGLELVLPGYRRLAELRHPGIAPVLDVEVDEGCPCLVTQYVPGTRLDEAMRQRPMPPRAAVELVAAVADALAEAHRQGIAHGGLRIESIVLDERGHPHVVDLGAAELARLAGRPESSAAAGGADSSGPQPPARQAFEQAARQDACDLVALLIELLGGGARAGGPTGDSAERPARPAAALARGLRAICRRGLASDPARRYADAGELSAALRRYLARVRRRLLLAAALAAALLAAWIVRR